MAKWKPVGEIDKSLADVDPDSVQSIYDEAQYGVPPKGPYLAVMKRLQMTESKAGDDMLKMVFEIAEPKGTKKAKYNGYSIWNYRVVNKDWAGAVNAFLKALFDGKPEAQRKKLVQAFWAQSVVLDDDGMVIKIGTFTIPDSVPMGINTRADSYDGQDRLAVSSVMPASDAPKSKPLDDENDEPEDDEEDEDATEDEDEDAEFTEREDELNALTLAKLRAEAKALKIDTTGLKKGDLVTAILGEEFPEDDEDEDEPEEEDEPDEDEADEEEADEFEEMDRAELKKFNTANKLGIKVTTKMTDEALRDAIRAALPEDEDEPEDDEPEEDEAPEPAPRRGRAKAQAAAPGRPAARRRRGGGGDEPPF